MTYPASWIGTQEEWLLYRELLTRSKDVTISGAVEGGAGLAFYMPPNYVLEVRQFSKKGVNVIAQAQLATRGLTLSYVPDIQLLQDAHVAVSVALQGR